MAIRVTNELGHQQSNGASLQPLGNPDTNQNQSATTQAQQDQLMALLKSEAGSPVSAKNNGFASNVEFAAILLVVAIVSAAFLFYSQRAALKILNKNK